MYFIIIPVIKNIYFSVVLIGVSSGSTVLALSSLLESVFNAMVLTVGLDEIKAMKNVERLKRDLRVDKLYIFNFNDKKRGRL